MESLPEGLKQKPKFRDGDIIYYLGQAVRLSVIRISEEQEEKTVGVRSSQTIRKQTSCKIEILTETNGESDEKVMNIYWPKTLGTPRPQLIRNILLEWYKQNAKKIIKERVKTWSNVMQLSYNRIAIKDQRTRWGSCSSLRNLNFNWRLVMAPFPILDYVIVHELAHLVEMNHSSRFWVMVESFFPDYRECKDWLKHNGMTLFYIA